MKAHFVTFLSPGTFFNEQTERPIDSWDVEKAKEMAHSVTERYNATPFAFFFTTRERGESELDSKQTASSGNYFLGGVVETVEDVRNRADPEEKILLSNMECNKWDRIITNSNSWKIRQPLRETDVVLEWTPRQKAA